MVSDGSAVTSGSEELAIVSAGASNKGIRREINEDAFSIIEKVGYRLFLVADGLGGPKRGAVASNLALSSIRIALKEHPSFENPTVLKNAVVRANKDVFEKAAATKTLHGMGTTLTGLVVAEDKIFLVNVGNSRAYRLRAGQLTRLTVDNTVSEELRQEGVAPSKQIDARPKSHLLTRSLGVKPSLEVEIISYQEPIAAGDVYLLCTDGLHDLVDDEEIAGIVAAHPVKDAVHLLINLANERGGHDNITVVLVQAGGREFRAVTAPVAEKGSPGEPKNVVAAASSRPGRRLAPLRGTGQEEKPAERAPRKTLRHAIPGRELVDLRERDDDGEIVPNRPPKAGRRKLKPPAPPASSSGVRGAQRLPASSALGKTPLSRRLPPLTQRVEDRKVREAGDPSSVGLLKGDPKNVFGKPDGAEVVEGVEREPPKASIELSSKSHHPPKSSASASAKPPLLASVPASTSQSRTHIFIGLGCGLLVGGIWAIRMLSTAPVESHSGMKAAHQSGTLANGNVSTGGIGTKGGETIRVKGGLSDDELSEIVKLTKEASGQPGVDGQEGGGESGDLSGSSDKGIQDGPLREIKEDGLSRIKDSTLRAMLVDVIDAIQQAMHSAHQTMGQLEQGEIEVSERLSRMAKISKEAVQTSAPTKQAEKGGKSNKAESPRRDAAVKKPQPAPTVKQNPPESVAQKKQRLIESLPEVDPLADQ